MKIDTHQHYWRYQPQDFGWISERMPVLQRDYAPADCQRRALSYDVLLFGHQLPDAQAFCARLDGHWLVLDHVGKPALRDWDQPDVARRWRTQVRALAQLPHVMCKLSGLVTETAWSSAAAVSAKDLAAISQCCDEALEAFGPQRVMFGSDWPVCQLAAPYAQVADAALQWAASRLSAAEQEAFWSGNAARAYGLALATTP